MGQYWMFINLSRREAVWPHGGIKFGEFFFPKQAFLVRSLTIPYPHPDLAKYLENPPPAGPVAKTGLLSLPDEILQMILALPVEELPLIDTICLAVTCKKLFCLSAHILEKERNISSSYWAHCRLACIGDYAAYDKAPDSLIPPAMKDEIRLALKKSPHDWHYAGTEALNFLEGQPVTYTALQEELQHRFFIMCLPESDRRRFLALTAIYFPARDDWVLCNTVKKEFVRAGPLAALSGHPRDPQPFLEDSHIDLGMALMTRFSWSSSDDTTGLGECVKDGKFGSWAGDRFCITTIEREADLSGPEYKDVTDEIIEDIKNIYQREDRRLDETNGPVQYRFYQWDRDLERFFGTGQDFEEDKKWAKAMALQSQKRLARRNAALRRV